jgi:hypothetical protein
MEKSQIAGIRLVNQQIARSNFSTPAPIVSWFGAMQAQDYSMAKWAIGLRLPGSTEASIEQAIASGQIRRTHLMRPTWHLVAAEDIRWLLALTSPQVMNASASMFRGLDLDEKTCRRSNETIARSLDGGKHLTRQELMLEIEKAGIKTDPYRAGCLMIYAELSALVCSGVTRGTKQTYALLDERVPNGQELSRDESIAELTRRYFTSHAPATLKDFVWWSGLSAADARKGLELNKENLAVVTIEGETYWVPEPVASPAIDGDSLYLLPAFDEFMVSYKDRSASLEAGLTKSAITGNGVFKPIIVLGGKVIGIWKRQVRNDILSMEATLFRKLIPAEMREFEEKAQRYCQYLGKSLKMLTI